MFSITPQLSNSIDDINDFDVPAFIRGDIVRFEAYYVSDEGGVGVIKEITDCEFKNKNYDPQQETDPDYDPKLQRNQLFISIPCAIVVSILPDEQWLDFVPLHLMEILTLSELMEEYRESFPEQDAFEVYQVRLHIARKLSDYRSIEWLGDRYVSESVLQSSTAIVPFQGGAQ